jgi:hypothetical protein
LIECPVDFSFAAQKNAGVQMSLLWRGWTALGIYV